MASSDDQQQDGQNAAEGGEEAVEWLRAVGMDIAVKEYERGNLIDGRALKYQLSFLTPNQRGTVQKRLTVLNNETLKKKKQIVRADIDTLPGVIQETNGSKYVIDSGKKRNLPNERVAILRNYRIDSDGVGGEPVGSSSHPYISESSTSQGISDHSIASPASNIQSVSHLPLPHDPINNASTTQSQSNQHRQQHHIYSPVVSSSDWTHSEVTNGHKHHHHHHHNLEGDFEADDDFFELIDADVDDDFVEEEEQEPHSVDEVDAPRLNLAPVLTGAEGGSRGSAAAPLSFPEPSSINNSLYSISQTDGLTAERTAAGSNLSSSGSTPSHQGNSSRRVSSSAVGGVADAVDRAANARSCRLGSTGSLPKVIVSSKARKNGRSTLYDLSQADVTRLNSLSLLQLTSLFDQHDIPFSIPKKTPKVSSKHSPFIFGRSITSLVEEETKMNLNQGQYVMCPRFVLELLRHLLHNSLQEDGILRKNGNLGRVKAYRHEIDQTFNQRAFDWNIVRMLAIHLI